MKHFLRRFLQFTGTRKSSLPIALSEMDEALGQYMTSLPSPLCVYLSPQHLLRLVPNQPRTAVAIWHEAIQAGMLPQSISFGTFREALMRLSPLFLLVTLTESNENQQETIISWQPWVSQIWRTNFDLNKIDHSGKGNVKPKKMVGELYPNALEVQIFNIIPKYFVSTHLVQERLRFLRDRSTCTSTVLEWHQLTSPPLASLLKWSDDYSIVRLSKNVSFTVPADDYYSLKSDPDIFHQSLNALALLLPTFMVSEKYVQTVYREVFINEQGVYHSVFGTLFISRFPDARALLHHPDLQFAIQRNETGSVMLHTKFLHTGRGVSNKFYELRPSTTKNSMTTIYDVRQEQRHRYDYNYNHNYVRNVLNTSLPYIPQTGDEVILDYIRGERLLGLQCTADINNDHFSLTLATVHGDVFCFKSTISSLHHLIETNIPHSGLPVEVYEALTSAQVVKIVAVDSSNVEECKSVEKSVTELICSCLNLNIKTVCNLWKLALFTGFPLQLPPSVSLSFYRHILLLRLGVTTITRTTTVESEEVGVLIPIALQIAMCAVRLCGLCGIENSQLDADTLHRLILDENEEMWLIRNVELRIRRYGAISHQGASLKSLQLQLQYLSLLYGPEVINISNERTDLSPVTLLTSPSSQDLVKNTVQASDESEQTTKEGENKDQSEEEEEEVEITKLEEKEEDESYFTALCAETDVLSTENKKNGEKITKGKILKSEEETTPQVSKNKNNDQKHKEEIDNNNNKEEEEEEVYNAMFATESDIEPNIGVEKVTPVTSTTLSTIRSSQKNFIDSEDQIDANSKSESLNFFLSPPSTNPNRKESVRGGNSHQYKKNRLPPAYSIGKMSFSGKRSSSVSPKRPSHFSSSLRVEEVRKMTPMEKSMEHHLGAVEKERDLMGRLAQEIIWETQQPSTGRIREGRTGNGALNAKTMELMRELLQLKSSHN